MAEPRRTFRIFCIMCIFAAVLAAAGCATPTATCDLIAIGRKGLASARTAEVQCHAEIIRHYQRQLASLDAAFDADVRMVAAGQLTDAEGKPVAMSAEWVISARKGYAAARNLLAEQIQKNHAAHATELDNLQAADEALQMASQLTVLQWNISERFKQQFLKLQERITNDQRK